MGFSCGIVGLPNVGKSTIFKALTAVPAPIANFPFCTIDPNTGIVRVPDKRLDDIAEIFHPEKVTPTTITFVDIAGLVKGASQGEGLGNQFLANIRETDAIAHVVRCFEDANIVHVSESVDPIRDVEIIDTELILADLQTVEKRASSTQRSARGGDSKMAAARDALQKVEKGLGEGKPVRTQNLTGEELELIRDLHLLTTKKVFYVANVNDGDVEAPEKNPHFQKLTAVALKEGSQVVAISGKIESEISELPEYEKGEFLKAVGLKEPGLHKVIQAGYKILGLLTFFTAGPQEVRAWTVWEGAKAPQGAGVIHTDFERGFIRAEIYHYNDLVKHRSETAIKDAGLMRLEGKDYTLRDGDVIFFRFAV